MVMAGRRAVSHGNPPNSPRGLAAAIHTGAMNQDRGPQRFRAPWAKRGTEWAYVRWGAAFGAALQGFWLITSIYIVVEVGLTPVTLLLLGTALEVTILLAEVPTGVMADTVSRKWALMVSMLVTAVAFIIAGLAGSFALLLVSKILWGIGYTFSSGADVAWITDELAVEGGTQEDAERAINRKARWQQRGGAAGLVIFGVLGYLTTLSVAMITAGALMVGLGIWVALLFPEEGFRPASASEETNRRGESARILRAGIALVRSERVVVTLLAVTVLFNLGAEAMDRLTELRLIELGLPGNASPVLFFTGLGILGLIAGAALLKFVEPHLSEEGSPSSNHGRDNGLQKNRGPRFLYGAMSLLAALGALIVTGAPTAAVAAIGVFLARGLAWSVLPVVSAVWINRATASETRATVQSFLGQATAAGQILGGLLLGAVSAAAGLTAAIALASALFAASGIVILRGGAAPGRPTST